MKKKMGIRYKLLTIWSWLFVHKKGVIVTCHYCNSSEVEYDKGYTKNNIYESRYTCTKCGARCANKEVWHRK